MNKVKEQKGFTLIEMLIVVAVIAILVAVSIPLVNASLERAREVTDAANEHAAKAEITLCYLTDSEYAPGKKIIPDDDTSVTTRKYYVYDAENGKLLDTNGMDGSTVLPKYGKCSKHDHKGRFLLLWIYKNGEVEMLWTSKIPATRPPFGNYKLCSEALNS